MGRSRAELSASRAAAKVGMAEHLLALWMALPRGGEVGRPWLLFCPGVC